MGRNARNGRRSRSSPATSATGRLGGLAAALAVVGAAVFALGLELGARREVQPVLAGDRLALLDDADRVAEPSPEPESLVFHDALTKDRPPDTLPPVPPKPVQVAVAARPAKPKSSAPREAADAREKPAAAPARAAAGPTPRIENSTWRPGVGVTPDGRWAIQIGASPDQAEARRIAAKHPAARIATADVDGKRWYRVRVAGFRSRSDAEAELARLTREAGARGFVVAVAP